MEEAIEKIAAKNRVDVMKIFSIMLQKESNKTQLTDQYTTQIKFAA